MIIDKIENAYIYYSLGEKIKTALKFLENYDIKGFKTGRLEVDGSKVIAICDEYNTTPVENGIWEAHRKYADIQFVVDGVELIGYSNIDSMKIVSQYDPNNDIVSLEGEGSFLVMDKGSFMILMPHDVHMPGRSYGVATAVKKIVMKVQV